MLQLDKLNKLRDPAARKRLLAQITEWELEARCSKEAEDQDNEQDGEESDEEQGECQNVRVKNQEVKMRCWKVRQKSQYKLNERKKQVCKRIEKIVCC